MIVRVRTKVGTWRHEIEASAKLSELIANLEHEKHVKILALSRKPDLSEPFENPGATTIEQLGLTHGDMIYADAAGATSASAGAASLVGKGPKVIDANGNLVSSDATGKGFRPGLQALRTQKLHWTLTDMVEFDNKYTFEVKGEQLSFCSSASLDAESCNNFQLYLQKFAFQTCRCAYLYGKYLPADEIPDSVEQKSRAEKEAAEAQKKAAPAKRQMKLSDLEVLTQQDERPKQGVMVHAIYEPLQENSDTGFQLLEDPREEKVDAIARGLGLERVGFLFSHPPGRENYTLSTHEIINAGEQALEATNGKFDSAFTLVKVTSDQGNASFDAFSLTPQCLEMVAEDALLEMKDNPGHAAVHETFTLIVEKKEAHVVDTDFFIKRVPILSHVSPFTGKFPRANRPMDVQPSKAAFTEALRGLGRNPSDAAIAAALADFHRLVFLTELFDSVEELSAVAQFVASHQTPGATPLPLAEGFKVVLLTFAGVDVF